MGDKRKQDYLRRKVRLSLMELGLSPDHHVYEVSSCIHRVYCDERSKTFVYDVEDFYMSLGNKERMVFIFDFLEAGRHYRYWWIPFYSTKGYRKAKREVWSKAERRLLCS